MSVCHRKDMHRQAMRIYYFHIGLRPRILTYLQASLISNFREIINSEAVLSKDQQEIMLNESYRDKYIILPDKIFRNIVEKMKKFKIENASEILELELGVVNAKDPKRKLYGCVPDPDYEMYEGKAPAFPDEQVSYCEFSTQTPPLIDCGPAMPA